MSDNDIFDQLIPPHLKDLKVYQAGKSIEELAREKKLEKIIKLASNENPLGPSPCAIREMTNALWDTHYYPDMYAKRLRQKLAELYNLDIENIILGNGSEGIMAYIAHAYIQAGDEILTSKNTFIGFVVLAKAKGANLKQVPLTEDYRFNIPELIKNITPKTKAIYIANPNNPTGTYIKKEEFDQLMEHVPKRCLVVLDEAYFEFASEFPDFPDSMDYRYDNVITLRTFSKAYGIAGIRVGYGFGHPTLISSMYKVKLPFAPNYIAQAGGHGALVDRNHLKRTLWNTRERRKETTHFLQTQGFSCIPSITNFIAFKTAGKEASQFIFEQLQDEGVIVRPLAGSGLPDFIRVSMGTWQQMQDFQQAFLNIMPRYREKYGDSQ